MHANYAPLLLPAVLLGCAGPEAELLELTSAVNGEAYALEILLPEGYTPEQSYPAVYMVDGYYHFDGLAKHVDRRWRSGELSEFILVGIGYDGLDLGSVSALVTIGEKRTVDLTWPESTGDGFTGGGGGQLFHEALVTELLPAVEGAYSVNPESRTLMGHSLGGHFALLDMLAFSPADSAFSTIVAASPSIWWAEGSLLRDEAAVAENYDDLPFQLIIGSGMLEGTEMNAAAELLTAQLESRGYPGLRVSTLSPKAGHMEAAERIFEHALGEIF